jgi:trimeric autotransporter adhesin
VALSDFDKASGGVVQLWVTDGTLSDTHIVASLGSGEVTAHLAIGSHVFFSFTDSANGSELWQSDGTAAGTVSVKGVSSELNSSLTDLANVDGTLYFVASDDFDGKQLWKSDGTAAGTMMVKAINPSGSSDTTDLTNVNGTLYFAANDGVDGEELWKSNGTAAGTVMVRDIDTFNTAGSLPTGLTNVGGMLYFEADPGLIGGELFKSDGTPGGTVLVKDIFLARIAPIRSDSRTSTALFTSQPTTARMASNCGSQMGPLPEQ